MGLVWEGGRMEPRWGSHADELGREEVRGLGVAITCLAYTVRGW
jgi:hypothetical protein